MTEGHRFAIVVSKFNCEVTDGLLNGALEFFREKGISQSLEDIFSSPGAFEIPLLAKRLAKTKRYSGIVCLGCVIKGETAHFEYISLNSSLGLMQGMLETEVPMSFGILTTHTEEQAIERSRMNAENKGREAAAACFELVNSLKEISLS